VGPDQVYAAIAGHFGDGQLGADPNKKRKARMIVIEMVLRRRRRSQEVCVGDMLALEL